MVADWTRRFEMERTTLPTRVSATTSSSSPSLALILRKAMDKPCVPFARIGQRSANASSIFLLFLCLAGCASNGGNEYGAAVPAAIPAS